ncbi:MAG TPA: NAD(P) transhydrogenase subunit alpha [Burkholderiales bacterium]|nr:NAD(P) transhydrogenase subunit alpha [Burkholderiales bacterium]
MTGTVDPTIVNLVIFVLAVFVGYHVIWNVTPALHTPLMSLTNAISSVIIVGAILAAGAGALGLETVMGVAAVLLASVNVAGGFLVTQRMLEMFKKKPVKGEGAKGEGK